MKVLKNELKKDHSTIAYMSVNAIDILRGILDNLGYRHDLYRQYSSLLCLTSSPTIYLSSAYTYMML